MKGFAPAIKLVLLFSVQTASAQDMSLPDVIQAAKTNSVQALRARSAFVSDYWAWRSYLASRLPSLSLYGEVGGFDRSLRMLQDYQTGDLNYVENYNMHDWKAGCCEGYGGCVNECFKSLQFCD